MSISSRNEKASAIHVGLPWRGFYPAPDAGLGVSERAMAAAMFAGHLSPLIVSTQTLQNPIDYALASDGDDDKPHQSVLTRRGSANYRALRGIFRE